MTMSNITEYILRANGGKTKPIGRFDLFMLQVGEPIQQILIGGSSMAWVRFMAEMNHRFGHFHVSIGGDPEQTITVMSDEEFLRKI